MSSLDTSDNDRFKFITSAKFTESFRWILFVIVEICRSFSFMASRDLLIFSAPVTLTTDKSESLSNKFVFVLFKNSNCSSRDLILPSFDELEFSIFPNFVL